MIKMLRKTLEITKSLYRYFLNKARTLLRKMPEIVISAMFIIILLVGCNTIYYSYRNLTLTNDKIVEILSELNMFYLSDSITDTTDSSAKLDQKYEEAYIERLQSASRGVIDSNAISFLFVVFSFGLISAGLWLLKESKNYLNQVNLKLSELEEFLICKDFQDELNSTTSLIYQNIHKLKKKGFHFNTIDNWILKVKGILEEALKSETCKNNLQVGFAMELLWDTSSYLHELKFSEEEIKKELQKLIDSTDDCIELLKKDCFIDRYDGQLT